MHHMVPIALLTPHRRLHLEDDQTVGEGDADEAHSEPSDAVPRPLWGLSPIPLLVGLLLHVCAAHLTGMGLGPGWQQLARRG